MNKYIRGKAPFCHRKHNTLLYGRDSNGTCKKCIQERNYYPANRNWHYRKQNIRNEDGSFFTLTDFDRVYQIQQGRCAICKKHQSELKYRLNADHDHKTGIFRGLLCGRCNIGLGILEDKEFCSNAVHYLKRK